MPDTTLTQSNSNNGTASPATPGSLTAVAGNLLIAIYGVVGTSPTLATPTNFTQIQKITVNSFLTVGMYMRANNPGGASNPSSNIGGTPTGWIATQFEFDRTGSNCALQGSFQDGESDTTLLDVFGTQPVQTIPGLLFIYSVIRESGASGIVPTLSNLFWSSSVQSLNVQGIRADFYWGSNLNQGPGPWPIASSVLSGNVDSVSTGAWFNSQAKHGTIGVTAGERGERDDMFYQGITGGG